MSLNFVEKNFILNGNSTTNNTLIFYKKGFELGDGTPEPTWQDVILLGNTALTLVNAKADGLNYLKLFGECEQDGTPTPETPVDIVANNGVIKVRNKSGLPLEYQRLEYLEGTGTQYIDTGIKGETVVTIDCQGTQETTTSQIVIGSYPYSPSFFGQAGTSKKWGFNFDTLSLNYLTRGKFEIHFQEEGAFYKVNDEIYNYVWSESSIFNTTANYALFRTMTASSSRYYYAKARIFSCSFAQNGVIVSNLIPARRKSDDVLGMYDTVTGDFLINQGTGTFTAGSDVDDTEIYIDGTTETVTIIGKNLFDKNKITIGYYYDTNLSYKQSIGTNSANLSDYIPVTSGSNYTLSGYNSYTSSYNIRITYFNDDKIPQSQIVYNVRSNVEWNTTITIPNGINYVRYSFLHGDENTQQFEIGSTATDYEPYKVLGTATAEMLLAVSENYRDIQEVLTGEITRNVTVKVLDGTESWSTLSSSRGYYLQFPNIVGVPYNENGWCTHFQKATWTTQANPMSDNHFGFNKNANSSICNSNVTFKPNLTDIPTVEDWKVFLANEYANGTPIIVVYPTSSPVAETVTPQPLGIQAGTNIITAEGSIDNLSLEVSYKAGVSVTITEVQNAQLDDNVEVTING